MTAQAEAVQPREGPSHPQITAPGIKGGVGLQWEELKFLYPQPCLATPRTAT